jgi:hypothetical protein
MAAATMATPSPARAPEPRTITARAPHAQPEPDLRSRACSARHASLHSTQHLSTPAAQAARDARARARWAGRKCTRFDCISCRVRQPAWRFAAPPQDLSTDPIPAQCNRPNLQRAGRPSAQQAGARPAVCLRDPSQARNTSRRPPQDAHMWEASAQPGSECQHQTVRS